jgi:cytochrome c oxidase subunit IV
MTKQLLPDNGMRNTATILGLRPCTGVWLALVVLTLLTFDIGRLGLGGTTVMGFVLLATFVKGQLVVDYFMGLRRARLFWRLVMFFYLAVVGSLIAVAYLLGVN